MSQATTVIELSSLPSKGLPYPENTKIEYRTYTFGEIKNSTGSTYSPVKTIKDALKCVNVEGISKTSLTILDAFYISFVIKTASLGTRDFTIPYACYECGHTDNHKFSHADIDFKNIDERVKRLPIKAEVNKEILDMAPMTVKQYIDLYSGAYNGILANKEPDKTALTAMLIKNMSFKAAYDFISKLTDADDMEVLNEVDKAIMHEIKPLELKCPNEINDKICDTELYIKLEGKEALLQPFRTGESPIKSRIQFGDDTPHKPSSDSTDGISNSAATRQTDS